MGNFEDAVRQLALVPCVFCGSDTLVTHEGSTYHCDVCAKDFVVLPRPPPKP